MRLIDADALKETICTNVYPIRDIINSQDYGMFWTGGIEKAIDDAPTIDAEPIRHGHWEKQDDLGSTEWQLCPICNRITKIDTVFDRVFEYCPHCGAKMDSVLFADMDEVEE